MVPPIKKLNVPAGLSLILASVSPRRASLLKEAGIKFKVVSPKVEEKEGEDLPYLTPAEVALNNAFRKARAVSSIYPGEWVLGADTIVVFEGRLIGKPKDMAQAREFLDLLNGKTHQVITAVFFIRGKPFHQMPFYDISRVTFNQLTLQQRDQYLGTIDPFDKAGAYAVQEETDLLIEKIEGSFSNVMGLPLEKLMEVLDRLNRHSKIEKQGTWRAAREA